jgi:hypothetical protein
MSALIPSAIIFILTLGGVFVGTLLRRTLPEHHLSDDVKDVVRLGVGLTATMAALVLGLLIAAAKSSFDTQTGQVRQITADLILLDNILAQYGPDARPVRQQIRSTVGPFADRLWREKESAITGPFETDGTEEQVYLGIQKLPAQDNVQRSLQSRAVQVSNDLAQARFLLFVESENLIPTPFLAVLAFWLVIIFASFRPVLTSQRDGHYFSFPVRLIGGVRNLSDTAAEPAVYRTDDDIQRATAKRPRAAMRTPHT